jgi:translation initiation factor 2D
MHFQIKALSPLRSSDRRKLADQIISDLDLPVPPKADESASAEEKLVATAALTGLRNSLLPENALSAKFTTTHGPELKQISGTVFVGMHEADDQRVLWFKVNDRLYPTGKSSSVMQNFKI